MTFRLSGVANIPAEINCSVTKIGRDLGRNELYKVFFDLCRLFVFRKTESSGDTYAVGIGYHCRLSEDITKHEVCGLSADARQCEKLLHSIGDFAAEIVYELISHFL